MNQPRIARVYLRVSTAEQDLARQEAIVENAKAGGYYVAGVYREKASGAVASRPELLRLIADLQPGEVLIAERLDRLTRLPLDEAQALVDQIKAKGARLAIPGVLDLSEISADAQGVAKVVLESVQAMLLRISLQMAREDYELRRERQSQGIELAKAAGKYLGRTRDNARHARIIELRTAGLSIARTAHLAVCSSAMVKRVWAAHQAQKAQAATAAQ